MSLVDEVCWTVSLDLDPNAVMRQTYSRLLPVASLVLYRWPRGDKDVVAESWQGEVR